MKKQQHEQLCLEIMDKCKTLRGLNPIMKKCLIDKMKFTRLRKGDEFKFKHFPKIDFFLVAEGRIEVRWYNVLDLQDGIETSQAETFFIRHHMDHKKIMDLYENQGIVN